jgi:signal transduction histidine kinase
MLEGFDKNWIQSGVKNFANYTNLSGGDYVFKVKAAQSATNWANEITSIKLVITPPFWKQWWFFVICAVVIGGAVYAIYRYRLSELLRRQEMRNKIAQDLHDNVGSTLSSISVYSQVARIQSENHDKEKLDKVLEKIGETSNEMISEMSDIVWAINPRNDDVKQILQRMQSFASPLLSARNIQFRFEYNPSIEHHILSMEKRKNFYMTFKEAINNAVKYSGACNVKVSILMPDHHHVRMTIEDDGKGFDTNKPRKGNGIWNIGYRAKEMGGKFDFNSTPGKGTRLMLEFPVP